MMNCNVSNGKTVVTGQSLCKKGLASPNVMRERGLTGGSRFLFVGIGMCLSLLRVLGLCAKFEEVMSKKKKQHKKWMKKRQKKTGNKRDRRMPFGKHKGEWLSKLDEYYLRWLADNLAKGDLRDCAAYWWRKNSTIKIMPGAYGTSGKR